MKHGYVVVSQDTRGRYGSEGVWHMMIDDVNDGYDTAQWLVHQPWSDGGFGMIGTSYVGGTQHAMAESNPPGLKALIPVDAVANAGYFGMRNGGAFELRFFNWIFTICAPNGSREARDPATRAALEEAAGRMFVNTLTELPLRKGTTPLKLAPEYEDWLVFAMGHGENDSYWKQPGFDVVDQTSPLQGCSRLSHRRLVRFLGAPNDHELHGSRARQARPRENDPRTLDPWPAHASLARADGLRPPGGYR